MTYWVYILSPWYHQHARILTSFLSFSPTPTLFASFLFRIIKIFPKPMSDYSSEIWHISENAPPFLFLWFFYFATRGRQELHHLITADDYIIRTPTILSKVARLFIIGEQLAPLIPTRGHRWAHRWAHRSGGHFTLDPPIKVSIM